MATPQALRTAITDLAVLADGDLRALWQQVSTADQANQALRDVLPPLIETYGLASATITADWYDEIRDLVEAKGRFWAIPREPSIEGVESLVGYAVSPLYRAEPDWRRAAVLVAGGMQRRIANASRYTVADSAVADPAAAGWQREGSGSCPFCALLIGRGVVYSEASADFASHDSCRCSAVPSWKGEAKPVRAYTPSAKQASPADRARVREYLRTH